MRTNTGRITAAVVAAAAALAAPPPLPTQEPTAPPRPKPCVSAEHRQFDFWVGSWDVVTPDGKPAGTNEVRSILGGCALQENWVGVRGVTGTSLNAWDAARGLWHQTWIDNGGFVLYLDGGFAGGRMVLSSAKKVAGGADVVNRVTWERIDGSADRVRQLWESSLDGGKTWKVAFDGTYVRRK
ncbi:MAG: hypothetical protein ABI592_05695 [Acidobacteriota bacterium]